MKNLLKVLYKYWMKFAHVLATINGFIILFLFYLVIIGLYALPYKMVMLFLRKKQVAHATFWKEKEDPGEGMEHLTYQF